MRNYLIFFWLLLCSIFHTQAQDIIKSGTYYPYLDHSNGVTFELSQVPLATEPLADTFHRAAIEDFIGKEIFQIPSEKEDQRIVSTWMNGFAATVYFAYDQHRPLALSPDDIWLLIEQGISLHVNTNFESLSPLLLKEDRPKEIRIRNDDLTSSADAWEDLINDLAKETQKHVQPDVLNFMSPKFSTTTPLITTAYNLTLLETLKEAFSYVGESGCGIPEITILGTQQDWKDIKERLKNLDRLGLNYWRVELEAVLDEFINVYDQKPRIQFWESIFKEQQFYGSTNITGWMLKFFPYIKKYEYIEVSEYEYMKKEVYEKNPFIAGQDYHLSNLGTSSLPKGYAEIDIIWDQYSLMQDLKQDTIRLYAGFVGIKQDKETLQLRPEISWYVVKNDASEVNHHLENNFSDHGEPLGSRNLWTSDIVDSSHTKPIFNPTKFSDHDLSLVDFRRILVNKLGKGYQGTKIDFIVTWSGTIAQISIGNDKLSSEEKAELVSAIEQMNYEWEPATNPASRHFQLISRGIKLKTTNVNYRLTIIL